MPRVGARSKPAENGHEQPAEKSGGFWQRMMGGGGGAVNNGASAPVSNGATAPANGASAPANGASAPSSSSASAAPVVGATESAKEGADAFHSTDGYAELTEQADDTRDEAIMSARASNLRFKQMVIEGDDDAELQQLLAADLERFRNGEPPQL